MTTQAQASSQHLAATRELLDELEAVTTRGDADPQTKATTAVAQSVLVLAEQVATIRVLMVEEALLRRANGQPVLADGQPTPAGGQPVSADGQRAPVSGRPAPADGQPAPGAGRPAPQETETTKKRRWW